MSPCRLWDNAILIGETMLLSSQVQLVCLNMPGEGIKLSLTCVFDLYQVCRDLK